MDSSNKCAAARYALVLLSVGVAACASNSSGATDANVDGQADAATDTSAGDGATPDASAMDSGAPDSGAPDGGAPDGGISDSGARDGGAPDSGIPDSGAPDSGRSDSAAPDGGCGAACCPTTCAALGADCGSIPDGCGGVLACGVCSGPDVCSGGSCVCPPATCGAEDCASVPDGCGGTLACGACNAESCPGGVLSVSGIPPSGNISGDIATFSSDHFGSCGGTLRPDAVYKFVATRNGTVTATLSAPGYRHVLYVRQSLCRLGTELACDAPTLAATDAEVTFTTVLGRRYFLFADSAGVSPAGPFTLTVSY